MWPKTAHPQQSIRPLEVVIHPTCVYFHSKIDPLNPSSYVLLHSTAEIIFTATLRFKREKEKKMSAMDAMLSLHYFPVTFTLMVASGLYYRGHRKTLCAGIALAGICLSSMAFYVQPLAVLKPLSGPFNVAVREVMANTTAGVPPVTWFFPTLAALRGGKGRPWLPYNDVRYVDGLAQYAGIPRLFTRDLRLTRVADSPSESTPLPLMEDDGVTPRPLVFFSHGIAGFPHLYTTLLMEMAASGALVAAVTHMDGSASFCRDAASHVEVPLDTALPWTLEAREAQLNVRVKETRLTLERLQSGALLRELGYAEGEIKKYLASKPSVTLVGHSFGGSTMMATALETKDAAATEVRGAAGPFYTGVVALDPWPLPLKGSFMKSLRAGTARYDIPTQIHVSEAWMRDKKVFPQLTTIFTVIFESGARVGDGRPPDVSLLPSAQTGHTSYSDMAVLSPVLMRPSFATADMPSMIQGWAKGTMEFSKNTRR